MERLTIEYCGEYAPKALCGIDRLGGADDRDLCFEYCKTTKEGNEDCTDCAINQCFNKLGEYEDLEEQGKLLILPCAVGDKLYEPRKDRGIITEYTVRSVYYSGYDIFIGWRLESGIYSNLEGIFAKQLGKSVFLTKEEALQKMKEMEGGA